MLRAKRTAATVMLQVVTIVDGTGVPRPRPNVKFLLNRHSQQTYEQFVRDVAYSLSRGTTAATELPGGGGAGGWGGPSAPSHGTTTGTDAAGGAPSVRLFTVRGREVAAMSDLFRDDDVFIGVGVGRQELSVPEVRQIFQELYPRGDYAETLVRKWVRARQRQVPRRRDDGLAGRKDSPANDAFARRPEEAAAARDAEPPEADGVVESETPESKPATEAPASDVRATTTVPRDPKPPEVTENVVENGTSASKWVSETGARTQGREETSARASGDADEPEVDGVVENGTSEESKPAAEAVARLEDDAAKTSENDDPGRRRRRVSQSLATPPRAQRRSRGESEPRPPGRTALPPIAAAASTSRSRVDDADSAQLVARSRPHHRSPGRRHVRLPPLNDPSAAAADPDRDLPPPPPPPGDAPPDDHVAAASPAAAAEPASRHADEKNAEELGRSPPRKLRQNESTASALAPSAAGQTRSAYPHEKIATPARCPPQKARHEDSSATIVSTETASGHADEKSAKHGRNPPVIKLWRDESLLVSSSAVAETRSRHADETDADPGRCPPGCRRQDRRSAADASTGTVSGNPPRKPWPDDIGALWVRNDYALYTSTHSLTHESRVRPSAVAETVSRYADENKAIGSRCLARQLRQHESCSSSAVSSTLRFSAAAATFSRHADEKDSNPASPVGNDGEVRRGSSSPAARRSVAVADSRTPPTARDRSPAAAAAAQQQPRKTDENCNVVAGVSRSDGIGVSQTNTARSGRDAESQDVITSRYTGSEP